MSVKHSFALVLAILIAGAPSASMAQDQDVDASRILQSAWADALRAQPLPTAASRVAQEAAVKARFRTAAKQTPDAPKKSGKQGEAERGQEAESLRPMLAQAEKDKQYWEKKRKNNTRTPDDDMREAAAAEFNSIRRQLGLPGEGRSDPRKSIPIDDPFWRIKIDESDVDQRLAQATFVVARLKESLNFPESDRQKLNEYLSAVHLAWNRASMEANSGEVSRDTWADFEKSIRGQMGVVNVPTISAGRLQISGKQIDEAVTFLRGWIDSNRLFVSIPSLSKGGKAALSVLEPELARLQAMQKERRAGREQVASPTEPIPSAKRPGGNPKIPNRGDEDSFSKFDDFEYDEKSGFFHPRGDSSSDTATPPSAKTLSFDERTELAYQVDQEIRHLDDLMDDGKIREDRYVQYSQRLAEKRRSLGDVGNETIVKANHLSKLALKEIDDWQLPNPTKLANDGVAIVTGYDVLEKRQISKAEQKQREQDFIINVGAEVIPVAKGAKRVFKPKEYLDNLRGTARGGIRSTEDGAKQVASRLPSTAEDGFQAANKTTLVPDKTPLSGQNFTLGAETVKPRKVNLTPKNPLDKNGNWGLRRDHVEKHFFGGSEAALKQIDPGGTSAQWSENLSKLLSMPETSRTSNGMIDVIGEFPRADRSGSYKMGVRIFERGDGTFDLVTVLTKQ